MKGNRTAAEEAARAAASLPIHTTAAEEAVKAAIGWPLHRSATEEAAKAAIGWPLHRSATEEAAKAAVGWQLHRTATEAAIQAIASFHLNHTNDIHKQIAATQSQLLKNLSASSFSAGITEIAKHAMMPLFQVHSATKIAAEAAQPFQHTDFAGMAVATLRDVDIRRLRGDGIATAFAAFQAEQSRGLESLRASFAGIAATALKQGLQSLNERDEHAFSEFENLIDEKIANLPPNQVTAESLLSFLLMLFIALGSLGADAFQVGNAIQSSKVQAQQHAQIVSVIERIAISTERLTSPEDRNVYYVAERRVALKVKPKNNSYTVTTIFPNQKTRLVQMNHQWVYVEYFDYLEGLPKFGWVAKKYLKRIPTKFRMSSFPRERGELWKDSSASLTGDEWLAITDQWGQTNTRRVDLIHKKAAGSITADEKQELEDLQRLADERIRLVAPLPIESLESALETIRRGN